uniref:Unspecific monooxygenase n=1 Tax=Rhabditophanes sp. KR3021 TaxID=114890 RepID=A0AC35U5R3_9BILA
MQRSLYGDIYEIQEAVYKQYRDLGLKIDPMDNSDGKQIPSTFINEYFQELSKEHGDIYTVFLPIPVVVLTSFEAIKEALVKKGDVFAGRPQLYPERFFQPNRNSGVIFSQKENWVSQRRITLHALRDFGMGKNLMEEKINASVNDMLEWVEKNRHTLINFHWPIQIAIANIINEIVFGFTTSYENSTQFQKVIGHLDESMRKIRADKRIFIYQYFTHNEWLINIFKKVMKIRGVEDQRLFLNAVQNKVNQVVKDWEKETEPMNFIHYYLNKIDTNGGDLNLTELHSIVADLMLAGMETTTSTCIWAVNLLGAYQDKQDKMRNEILRVIGSDVIITMKDKARLPYCSAAISEIQRYANILPLNVAHSTLEDTEIRGLKIPKGTMVFPQIYNVMKYDKEFVDADNFIPERFLNEDMTTINKSISEKLIPFSMGKRQCVGEGMAVMELFLIITRLVQKYKLAAPSGKEGPSLKRQFGSVMRPPYYDFEVTPV